MAAPELKVEIAFDEGPYVASPTWEDITEYVREVKIHRGRSDDWDDSFVSTATLVLNNDDRSFDPFDVGGTWFNKLRPRRQIRIQGIISGTEYPIFRGFVNGFPVTYQAVGKVTTVRVEAFDVLALVSASELKGDLAEIYTKSLSPVHYYRCSEPSGTTVLKDLGSANENLTHNSAFSRKPVAYVPLGLGLSGTSVNVPYGSFGKGPTTVTSTTGDMTVSMWSCGTGQASRQLFLIGGSGSSFVTGWVGSGYGSGGTYIQIGYGDFITANWRESKQNGFDSTVPHHLLFTYKKSTGQAKIYVDGVDLTNTTGGDLAGVNIFPTASVSFWNGAYQEVAIFDKVLTATEITNLYQFGAGNQTENTNARLTRLLQLTDIPSAMYSVYAAGTAQIAGVPEPNSPVIEALLKAQKTEGGYLFVDKAGVLTATDRLFFQGKASAITFADDGTGFGYSGDIDMWYDGDNLRNDVVVKYGGNSSSQASGLFDTGSITDNGRHTLTVESQASTDTSADSLAKFWLRYGIQNPPQISPFEVGLNASTAQWVDLLGLELLDRVTFRRTPPAGTQFQRDLLINSIEFDLKPKVWSMKLSGSSRFTVAIYERTATGSGAAGASVITQRIIDAPEIRNVSAPAYNQDSATFYGEVNAFGTATNVRIQYSTDSLFGTYTEVTPTPSVVTGSSWTGVSAYVSGLSNGTTYYFRVKAYNAVNTVYGSGGGITTYRLKTVRHTASGSWTAPTWGGTASTVAFYTVMIAGGGGSGGWNGGGGGGGGTAQVLTNTLASTMVATVGAFGADGASGGDSGITNFPYPCYGGGSGSSGSIFGNPDGGASGVGYGGGAGLYVFFTGEGIGGGGGGATGVGGNYQSGSIGGNGGGAGYTSYGNHYFGGGGAGHGNGGLGTHGGGTWGRGGQYGSGGSSGFIEWLYYGPPGSRSGSGWTEVNY
jgi:hypothetical protein